MCEDNCTRKKKQEAKHRSAYLADRCYIHPKALLMQLKDGMDRRLVQTFLGLVMVTLIHRHRNQGLLLSELGGYLLDPDQAPAGDIVDVYAIGLANNWVVDTYRVG